MCVAGDLGVLRPFPAKLSFLWQVYPVLNLLKMVLKLFSHTGKMVRLTFTPLKEKVGLNKQVKAKEANYMVKR